MSCLHMQSQNDWWFLPILLIQWGVSSSQPHDLRSCSCILQSAFSWTIWNHPRELWDWWSGISRYARFQVVLPINQILFIPWDFWSHKWSKRTSTSICRVICSHPSDPERKEWSHDFWSCSFSFNLLEDLMSSHVLLLLYTISSRKETRTLDFIQLIWFEMTTQ
jgi:hypothetical protein